MEATLTRCSKSIGLKRLDAQRMVHMWNVLAAVSIMGCKEHIKEFVRFVGLLSWTTFLTIRLLSRWKSTKVLFELDFL